MGSDMPVPDAIQKKADRRIYLWHKNKGLGLTKGEIEEYKRLVRSISVYIKKTWPDTWANYLYLSNRNKIEFKAAPPKKKKSDKTLLQEKIMAIMDKKANKLK